MNFIVIRTLQDQLQDILLGTVHLDPEDAVEEINSLVGVFDWAQRYFDTPDVMVIGDYNAGCSYVKERDWPRIQLWTNKTFTWIVPHDMDTTAMASVCAYTRAVYTGQTFKNTYLENSVEAPDFAKKFNLNSTQARLVSDHRLVKMTFNGPDSKDNQLHTPSGADTLFRHYYIRQSSSSDAIHKQHHPRSDFGALEPTP
ncbi:deoxyribonuclease-1-like isoform X2 [Paramacrobiotus metropolitanus]|uniref:deoxyribonuclease-1-like isoform X2 n=1 Tax=Paramacrobiotus metropolitanus TaxID=2943436 RepID=UPI00244623AF|nr:deoxyribonuclease-1-like isoform X2 [Paramacrobiotus metropolitanus]